MPRIKHVKGTWLHRRLGDRLFVPEIWKPERLRVAGGMAIGSFFAMIPLPIQMPGAALVSYLARMNLPTALAATWISNPITAPFSLYIQYKIGCFLVGKPPREPGSIEWWKLLSEAPLLVLMGAVITGIILAIVMYPVALLGWDLFAKRLHKQKPPQT
jgi:uncharacterized protein (DUF2062 family)